MKQRKRSNKSWLIITGSILFVGLGISLIGGKYLYKYLSTLEDNKKIDTFFEEQEEIINVEVDVEMNEIEQVQETKKEEPTEDYIAVLEIPKINLKRGIYAQKSKLNNVNKNVYLLKESDMPNIANGNFILAGHSGNAYFSYFKNLIKLKINDVAYVYYKGGRYKYKLVNSYEIVKTGTANIYRNINKTNLTLITCKHGTNKQLVYIFEREDD